MPSLISAQQPLCVAQRPVSHIRPANTLSPGLTRSTAWGYAKEDIRFNAVIPGGVGDTQMMSGTDPAVFQCVGSQVTPPFQACMLGMCKPADIADVVLFCVTAPTVNRPELAVDYGWTVA